MTRSSTLGFLIVLLCAACTPGAGLPERSLHVSVSSSASASATTAPAPGTVFGVAGLVRPHAPSTSAADFEAMYRSFSATGGAVGVYTNWSDGPASEGSAPAVVASTFAAAQRYGFGPVVVALGVAQDAGGTGVKSTVDWSGPQRDRFIAAATAVARDQKPAYLALGVETNRLATSDPAAFDGFVKGYAEAYDAIKKVSPTTKVFTIFQLELMKGHATRMTGRDDPPQWPLLQRFAGKLDLVGLTTYPFLQYLAPADVPADYYAEAAQQAGAPVAFTEIGWPSSRPPATGAAYVASPEAQAAFVDRFFALTASPRPALALWSFPYELGVPTSLFDSVALRASDGTAKPALGAWQKGIAGR